MGFTVCGDPRTPTVPGYEILGELGRGGMGVVYKARHLALKRIVALKMILAGGHASAHELSRFRVEAEAVARLQHPNIVQIHEVGESDGHSYCALEFVEGGSLAEKLGGQPLPARAAAQLVETLARAMQLAHSRNVVHRDLKPANILLAADGTPKITDFGLARQTDSDSGETQAGAVMGTPSYMAPEQASGRGHEAGPAADVYALGAILYDCLAGRPPFKGKTVVETLDRVRTEEPVPPSHWQAGVPLDLDTVCLKCLRKEPEKRYASAAALAEELQRYLDDRPIQARPVGDIEKLTRWCRRNPLAAALLTGIVALFVTAFVLVSWSYFRAEDARKEEAQQRQAAQEREKAERWERYRANIIAASSAMQLHNVSAARSALDAAPEEHRNWEWKYFQHQLDTSQHVVRVGDDIQAIKLSPDGTIAAVQSASGPARLWNLSTRQEIGSLRNRSPVPVNGFEFSPDSKTLAYQVTDENRIFLWDIAAGRERAVLSSPEKWDLTPHFSPNGTRLVAGFHDRTGRVWDTATGKQLLVLHGHEDRVFQTGFSPDGRRVVSAGTNDRTARLWDAETGQSLAILTGHDGPVGQAFFNPQGDRVLTAESYPTNALRLWDAATGKLLAVMPGHTNQAEAIAFSPDGTRIASGGLDQTVHLWDGRTGQALASRDGHRGSVTSVAFSPDSKYLISAAKDQTARLWDATTGKPLGVLHGHTGAISAAQYTPDGRTIVTASVGDGSVRLWDARSAERNGSLRGHENFVYSVAFHPDGECVASAAWDGTVRIWDATTGRQISLLSYPSTRPPEKTVVSSVAFHPAGNLVAAFGRDGAVRFWDLTTAQEAFCFQLPPGNLYSSDPRVAFSSRGNLLAASGGSNNSVHVWDVERRIEVAVLQGHRGWIKDICFSPDGSWLATGGQDRTVRIWDVVKQEQIQVVEGHTDEVYALAVSRDGKWLASGSRDGTVRLWDTNTWKEVAVLKHGTIPYGLAFTPDGTRLASACANNMIRFWDMTTFQLVAELEGHGAYVHQIAFSPDGTRLVSGSGDFTVRIWDSLSVQERTGK